MRWMGVVLVGVVLAGVGLWFFAEAREGREEQGPRPPVEGDASAAATGTGGDVGDRPGAGPVPDAAIDTVPFEPGVSVPAARQMVLVVDGESGDPVPYAEVYRLDPDALDPGVTRELRRQDPAPFFRKHGQRHECDGRGTVWVAKPSPRTVLCAVRGSDAVVWTPRGVIGEEVIRIAIIAVRGIAVQVGLASGGPAAGVPVALVRRFDFAPHVLAEAVTGPDGSARILLGAEETGLIEGADADTVCEVVACVVAEPEVRSEVTVDPPPAQPVELVLPATGSVRVCVVAPDGTPLDEDQVVVTLQREVTRTNLEASFTWMGAPPQALEAGEAVFRRVGLGLSVQASVHPGGTSVFEPRTVVGAGPRSAGEEVVLRMVLEESRPVITGRLVTAEGEPCTSGEFSWGVYERDDSGCSRPGGGVRGQVGGDGRFRVVLEALTPSRECSRELRFISGRYGPGAPLVARADLSGSLPRGESDVGDLIVGPEAVVVSGVVADGRGQPVEGAWISVAAERPSPALGGEGVWVLHDGGNDLIVRESDAAGRFAVYGVLDDSSLTVVARKVGHYADPVAVTRGTEDLRLRLDEGGSFRARIEIEGMTTYESVYADLRAEDQDETGLGRTGVSQDGIVSRTALRPNTYRLVIASPKLGGIIEEVRGIQIGGGSVVDLGTIKIAIAVRTIVVDVVDREGRPVPSGRATVFDPGDASLRLAWQPIRQGQATLACRRGAADLVVSSRGYREVRIADVEDRVRVVLHPPLEIILVLENIEALPAAPCKLVLGASSHSGEMGVVVPPPSFEAGEQRSDTAPTLPPGEFRLTLDSPGRHGVSFMVQREGTSMGHRGLDVTIDVQDLPGVQRIPITLDAAAVAQLVEQLER